MILACFRVRVVIRPIFMRTRTRRAVLGQGFRLAMSAFGWVE
jgi:hypothetical protein